MSDTEQGAAAPKADIRHSSCERHLTSKVLELIEQQIAQRERKFYGLKWPSSHWTWPDQWTDWSAMLILQASKCYDVRCWKHVSQIPHQIGRPRLSAVLVVGRWKHRFQAQRVPHEGSSLWSGLFSRMHQLWHKVSHWPIWEWKPFSSRFH